MEKTAAPASAPNWVTVAEAARLLTAAGDKIDASNVSRYLKRFRDIPQKREGKYRYADLTALIEHRSTNVQVADKQASRSLQPASAPTAEPDAPAAETSDGPDEGSLGALNLALKQLEFRKRKREEDLADGTVVQASEVLQLISGTVHALISGLETGEAAIAQRFGREIAADFRKNRKTAMASASTHLGDLARKHLPAQLAVPALAAADEAEKMAPPEA